MQYKRESQEGFQLQRKFLEIKSPRYIVDSLSLQVQPLHNCKSLKLKTCSQCFQGTVSSPTYFSSLLLRIYNS